MSVERIDTSHYPSINLDDYEPVGKRQFRFKYDGSWTRWFTDSDDLSWLKNVFVDAIETSEMIQLKVKNDFKS